MKMKYEKPMVSVDQFKFSQAIAGCAINVGATGSLCFLTSSVALVETKALASIGYFTEQGNCVVAMKAGVTYDKDGNPSENFDGLCYHTNVNGAIVS